jgi:hypothetical protein
MVILATRYIKVIIPVSQIWLDIDYKGIRHCCIVHFWWNCLFEEEKDDYCLLEGIA